MFPAWKLRQLRTFSTRTSKNLKKTNVFSMEMVTVARFQHSDIKNTKKTYVFIMEIATVAHFQHSDLKKHYRKTYVLKMDMIPALNWVSEMNTMHITPVETALPAYRHRCRPVWSQNVAEGTHKNVHEHPRHHVNNTDTETNTRRTAVRPGGMRESIQ